MAAGGIGPGQESDALTAACFEIQIDGHNLARFSELQGISSSIDVVDFIESGEKDVTIKKLPGKRTPPTVVLKRGMTKNLEMAIWHQLVLEGKVHEARKTCSLVMSNTSHEAVAVYNLEDAWPAKIEIGALKAGASEVLLETVTLVCEQIQRKS